MKLVLKIEYININVVLMVIGLNPGALYNTKMQLVA